MEQCTGFTRRGERCKKPGANGTDRCAYHTSRDDSEARLVDEIRTLREAAAQRTDEMRRLREVADQRAAEVNRLRGAASGRSLPAKSYHERRALALSDRDLIVLAHLLAPDVADLQWLRDQLDVSRQRVYQLKEKVRREVLAASGEAVGRRSSQHAHAPGAAVPPASKAPPYEYLVLDAICDGAEDAMAPPA